MTNTTNLQPTSVSSIPVTTSISENTTPPPPSSMDNQTSLDSSDDDEFIFDEFEFDTISEDSTYEDVSAGSSANEDDDFNQNQVEETEFIPPSWFSNEDTTHIQAIFEKYSSELISRTEFIRSHQPFIGRILRRVTRTSTLENFQTFDEIEICNNQRVKAHKELPLLRRVCLVSRWDEDGLPSSFFRLNTAEQEDIWMKTLSPQIPESYLYCLPDWFQQGDVETTRFIYSSSSEYQRVTHANLPWEKAAYHCVSEICLPLNCNNESEQFANDFGLSSSPPV